MLSLLIICFALLICTYSLGAFLQKSFYIINSSEHWSGFETILSGLCVMLFLSQLINLFFPNNEIVFAVIFLACIIYFLKNNCWKFLQKKIVDTVSILFSREHFLISILIFSPLILFSIIEPLHGDSQGYHYDSIRWAFEYKAVPGIANLHSRFGFNSSFFTLSALTSFRNIFSQSIYALNPFCIICFYTCLLIEAFKRKNKIEFYILIVFAVFMLRHFLFLLSSPSPDALWVIFFSYLIIQFTFNKAQPVLFFLLCITAITIKLSALLMGFIAFFFFLKISTNKLKIISLFICFVVLCSWICRNYIVSGYLAYPISFTGFLNPDWKLPENLLHFDVLLIHNGPKLLGENWQAVESLSFVKWFTKWVTIQWQQGIYVNLFFLLTALVSIIVWIKFIFKKSLTNLFLSFLFCYTSLWFWLLNAPDYRFGYVYIISCLLLTLFYLLQNVQLSKLHLNLFVFLLGICAVYFSSLSMPYINKLHSNFFLLPPKDFYYSVKNNIQSFEKKALNNKIELYLGDSLHHCINAPLPCSQDYNKMQNRNNIQARGKNISNGFRIVQ